ncbi:Hypothetical protein I5071_58220 [Sandaracinus amylolyticus]|nr:Hypothetical protein I5071_58220 [Sandaracinus amylolyticus]
MTRLRATRAIQGALALALAAFALVSPAPAHADDLSFELPFIGTTTFSMTSTTTLRYRGNNYDFNRYDDDFGSLYQRFDLALQSDELRLEVRLDAFLPTTIFEQTRCPPGDEVLCYVTWDVRPERIALRWEHDEWLVEAGDSQLVLGRGIALAFRKVDLLAVDNALRGGHVRYDGSHVDARLHVGLANPQNQDPITLGIVAEPEDLVIAGEVELTVPSDVPLTIGLHGDRVWFMDDPLVAFEHRTVDVAGWSVEAPALFDGRLAIYGEANGLRRTYTFDGRDEQEFGRAVYASAQVQGDELTVLVEWADYENYLVAPSTTEAQASRIYSAAPTLEYEGPQLLRGVGNRRGGAVRIDYAFLPGPWSFSVNEALYGFGEHGRDPWDGTLVSHTWGSLARRQEFGEEFVWSTNVVLGYRHEQFLHDPDESSAQTGIGSLDRRMVHGQVEVTVGSGEHSFDVSVDHRVETWFLGFDDYRDFQVGGASITYSWGVPLALTVALRWSDFRLDELMRREQPEYDYNVLGGAWYPSIEARWSFDPGTFLKAFVGQTPGGQICSGGVCRTVPAFEGFMLQFVGRL